MENQNEKNVDKKAAEVHEKLTDETIDKTTGGGMAYPYSNYLDMDEKEKEKRKKRK